MRLEAPSEKDFLHCRPLIDLKNQASSITLSCRHEDLVMLVFGAKEQKEDVVVLGVHVAF
jgi:hypothetical protein